MDWNHRSIGPKSRSHRNNFQTLQLLTTERIMYSTVYNTVTIVRLYTKANNFFSLLMLLDAFGDLASKVWLRWKSSWRRNKLRRFPALMSRWQRVVNFSWKLLRPSGARKLSISMNMFWNGLNCPQMSLLSAFSVLPSAVESCRTHIIHQLALRVMLDT